MSIAPAVALIFGTIACGDDAKPRPTVTPSVSSGTPSGTAVPTDLALADRLYYEGDFEEAMAIYAATATGGAENERNEALWSLTKVQYERGEFAEASRSANEFLTRETPADEQRRATLLLGMIEFAQGNPEEARRSLSDYVDSTGPATPYAQLRLADLAALRDDHARAIELAQTAIAASLPAQVEDDALFAIARLQADAGDITGALATYASLGVEAEFRIDRAEAFWLAGDLAYRSGDPTTATNSLRALVLRYPAQARALEALSHPGVEAALSDADRGPVLFQQRLNDQATQTYAAIIADADAANDADAHYHLGILAERAANYDEALTQYDAAIALLPPGASDDLLGQSLWDRATVYERFARLDEAVGGYASIADLAPASEHVHAGLFRAGFLRYQQGRSSDATPLWERLLQRQPDPETQARIHFWLANAASDSEVAAQHRTAAVTAAPFDYHGLRSQAQLLRLSPTEIEPPNKAPAPDWAAIRRWLTPPTPRPSATGTTTSAQTATPTATPIELPNLDRALELLHAGLGPEADAEFEMLLEKATIAGRDTLLRFAEILVEEDRTSLAARAGARLADMGPAGSGSPPLALRQLAYPLPYYDLVAKEAEANNVSPLLLLAVVRQESFYDPSAASPAAATGLTQVIPGTGADIAAALGDTDFTNSDLLRPNVSLRFGAFYLAQQIEHFEGNVSAALAAYNGGAGNSARWLESSGNDPDLFLETIDFPETHSYVELVMEHYAAYLYAYALTNEPSLALD